MVVRVVMVGWLHIATLAIVVRGARVIKSNECTES